MQIAWMKLGAELLGACGGLTQNCLMTGTCKRHGVKVFGEEIKWCRSPVTIEGLRVGFERASRPNSFDEPTWDDWEVEKAVVDG